MKVRKKGLDFLIFFFLLLLLRANGWHTSSVHLKFLDACRGSVPLLKTNDPPPLCHVPPSLYRANTPNIPTRCVIDFQWRSTASRKIYRRSRASFRFELDTVDTHIDHNAYRYANFSVYRNREREREARENRMLCRGFREYIRRAKIESGQLEKRLIRRITRE